MKHFVTLFPPAENVHLVKDVGQIPWQLQQHYDYRSTLVCYQNGRYPYHQTEVPELEIEFVEDRGRLFYWEKAFVSYLIKKSRSIDVLNVYHLTQESILYGLLYKLLNPRGILYLKLDMNVRHYETNGIRFSEHALKEAVHQRVYLRFRQSLDLASAETGKGLGLLQKLDEELYRKTIKLPSGLNNEKIKKKLNHDLYAQKENIMLTVGRIGSHAKNSELLLEAISRLDLKDWIVYFVGPIEEGFQPTIDHFFKNNPEKKEKVMFTGAVIDRDALWAHYARAKIFCLPSRWESFAIVLCEAQRAGNYIIGTDTISSIEELTGQGTYGDIIGSGDAEALRESLQRCMEEDFYSESRMNEILSQAENYDWPLILEALDTRITEIGNQR